MAKKDKNQNEVQDDETEIEAPEAESTETEIEDDGLVAVHKDGETIRIHPTTVKAHHTAGWKAH